MMLWFIMALMTAAAIFAVLWPLARRSPLRSGSDIAVYRDQLDEIERDRAASLIGEREAEAARIEVSRRLLAAADTVPPALPQDGMPGRRRAAALAALILLPLSAASLYLSLGSPELTKRPLEAGRGLSPEQSPIMELVVEFWPAHYMALYHAGAAEAGLGQTDLARKNLKAFLELYHAEDGWRSSAKSILGRLVER